MRIRMIVGAAMVLLGGFILARGLTYSSKSDVVDLGPLRVSAEEKKPVPPWIGGVVAVIGLALVFAPERK